jgi:hypothetical protein
MTPSAVGMRSFYFGFESFSVVGKVIDGIDLNKRSNSSVAFIFIMTDIVVPLI